jgi:hypothetical protein
VSTPNPIVSAAAPELVAVLQAILQFNANMGADPTQWLLKYPGAVQVLLGTALLQVPALATAEAGAIQGKIDSTIGGWIAKLQGK